MLHSTNNFPEFTGRVCPAPCEAACTLNINDDPVGIKSIEHFIIDKGWEEGWVVPQPPATQDRQAGRRRRIGARRDWRARSSSRAPATTSCCSRRTTASAACCAMAFRISRWSKHHIDRRVRADAASKASSSASIGMSAEPVSVGVRRASWSTSTMRVAITAGSEHPRDLDVPGRELDGVHFAMDFLPLQNQARGRRHERRRRSTAAGKHVVVIGGGDTGSDCVGTSNRQGALSVTQFELLPQPPEHENKPLVWPYWPMKLRTSSSHEEGCAARLVGADQGVRRRRRQSQDARRDAASSSGTASCTMCRTASSSSRPISCCFAMGYRASGARRHARRSSASHTMRAATSHADTETYRTSVPKVFAAGRHAARAIARRLGDTRGASMRACGR